MTTKLAALVTGANSGIGLEFARLFAKDGYDLVLVARDSQRLETAAQELREHGGITVTTHVEDLSIPGAAARICGELNDSGIAIDVLVNNAGFNVYGAFTETDAVQEQALLQVNVVALTELTKYLLPAMVRRGRGRVLNVGSTGSFAPGPFDAVYCASKAYVLSLSEAIAEEVAGTGVSVTALCPGATKTRFAARAGMTHTRMFAGSIAEPREVAAAGYRALMRGRRVVIPGYMNALMTASIRFSPRTMVASVSRRMLRPEGVS